MPRSRNLFDPASTKPYKISRSGLELFHDCPRCFYYDKRLGHSRPAGFPFNLNSAVDALLKREFDAYRDTQQPHPLMKQAGIEAVPFAHADLEKWRTNFTGVQALHAQTNFLVTGAVDDVWENAPGELVRAYIAVGGRIECATTTSPSAKTLKVKCSAAGQRASR